MVSASGTRRYAVDTLGLAAESPAPGAGFVVSSGEQQRAHRMVSDYTMRRFHGEAIQFFAAGRSSGYAVQPSPVAKRSTGDTIVR